MKCEISHGDDVELIKATPNAGFWPQQKHCYK